MELPAAQSPSACRLGQNQPVLGPRASPHLLCPLSLRAMCGSLAVAPSRAAPGMGSEKEGLGARSVTPAGRALELVCAPLVSNFLSQPLVFFGKESCRYCQVILAFSLVSLQLQAMSRRAVFGVCVVFQQIIGT